MFNLNFEWYFPTRIVCREKLIDEVGTIIKDVGKRALLLTGQKSMERLGYVERAIESLKKEDIDTYHYKGIPAEPEIKDLTELTELVRRNKYDFIIALGGGSVIDSAKAAAVVANHPGKLVDYLRSKKYGNQITKATLPIVAIPSTSGSGSETSCYAVLNNEEEEIKDVISSHYIYPAVCIIDPEIPANAPESVKLSSGVDVLAHAVESYISKKASDMVASFSIQAIDIVFRYLPIVLKEKENIEAHAKMAIASAMTGISIALGGTVVGHAMAHAWGASSNITHGVAVGALLPWVIEINEDAAQDKLAYLADVLLLTTEGMAKHEKVEKVIMFLKDFYKRINFDMTSLRNFAKDIDIKNTAAIAMKQPVILNNPYPVKEEDIENELKRIANL
jgi:alcohol dehydrogenase